MPRSTPPPARPIRSRRSARAPRTAAVSLALLAMLFAGGVSPGATSDGPSPSDDSPADIAPELLAALGAESTESADASLSAADDPADVASTPSVTAAGEGEEATRIEVMVYFTDSGVAADAQGDPELAAAALQQNADTHWDRIDDALSALEAQDDVRVLNRFWVTSAVLVSARNDARTLTALAELPGASSLTPNYDIEGLAEETPTAVDEPTVQSTETAAVASDAEELPVTYGIETIRADDAWRDFGAEGQGVRVAVLDTGVDASHPDIAARLVGRDTGDPSYPGGWINFDRAGNPIVSTPTDPGSHGTHVAGTIVGGAASGTRIGVAPQAELMAANVLSGGGSSAKILRALEWVIAPFDGEGNPVGRAADVINMSLGSGAYDATLIQPLRNVRAAGIFPAIAIGNAPCGVTGTSSPGDIYEAFGVGMTNADDEVDPGSCGAVTAWPATTAAQYGWPESFVKPDASAPGTRVFSAMPNGLWGEATGTSMATPHVAGAVALLRSAQGGLSVDEIAAALESTAWHPDPERSPDSRYGHGRIDVHAAIASVLGTSGVTGVVRDAVTGDPVAGAQVSYGAHGETWTTDAQGRFTARLVPGTYTLSVSRFGFTDGRSAAVTVTADRFAEVEVALEPITTGALGGIIVDHSSGAPLAGATVSVLGVPVSAVTASDGSFLFADLPVGSYRLRVEADGRAPQVSDAAEVRAALTTTVNFRLAELPSVLVIGDNAGRTAALLDANGFVAEHTPDLPGDPTVLAGYDAVVWDRSGAVTADLLTAALSATDAAGTGIVWLDLGDGDDSGIARLSELRSTPETRGAGNDRSLTATGYRIVADHPLFAGGALSSDPLEVGSVLRQNTAESGPKFYAWFSGLVGDSVQELAETVVLRSESTGDDAERTTTTETLGTGIAVEERATNRHAFLALHGSAPAVDARTWSLASTQVLINAVAWASPVSAQAPEPEIIVPVPPEVPPGDGGERTTPEPTTPTTPALNPTTTGTGALRAPTTQGQAQPAHRPAPPVEVFNQLTSRTAGGVTLRLESGIAHVQIPNAQPGDWFFLHVYPGAIAVDWIRVNDDGELRIDTAKLPGGSYRFAFTDAEDRFVGWVGVTIPGAVAAATVDTDDAAADRDPVTAEAIAEAEGWSLSTGEQLMLLGAALLLLTAAGVIVFASRRAAPDGGASPGVPTPEGPAPDAAPDTAAR